MRKNSYLAVASEHLTLLQQAWESGRPVIGTDGESEHFHHALVVIVFSAMAVEYAVGELLAVRMLLQTPDPQRRLFRDSRILRGQVSDKLRLLKTATQIPDNVISKVQDLFEYRNNLVHTQVEYVEVPPGTPVVNPEEERIDLSAETARYLSFPWFATDVLSKAEEYYRLAVSVVESLGEEVKDPEWWRAVQNEG